MAADEMTVTEAAALLGVSRIAVGNLIRRGILPARRLGRFYVLTRADVLAYQASKAGRQRPGPAPGTPRPRHARDDLPSQPAGDVESSVAHPRSNTHRLDCLTGHVVHLEQPPAAPSPR